MPKPEKIEAVAELKEQIQSHQLSILTKYVGIKAGQVSELRRRLREQQVELKVYKNTLARRALDELGITGADAFLEGPTAWAFSEDPIAPAKIFRDYGKEVPVVGMNGGILNGRPISPVQLEVLADMPPKDQMVAQVVGTIAAPLRNFVGALSALPRNLVNALDQIRKQKEEGGAAA